MRLALILAALLSAPALAATDGGPDGSEYAYYPKDAAPKPQPQPPVQTVSPVSPEDAEVVDNLELLEQLDSVDDLDLLLEMSEPE